MSKMKRANGIKMNPGKLTIGKLESGELFSYKNGDQANVYMVLTDGVEAQAAHDWGNFEEFPLNDGDAIVNIFTGKVYNVNRLAEIIRRSATVTIED